MRMACKCLTTTINIIPGGSEVGGPLTPQGMPVLACKLGRRPDIQFWASRCNKTPTEGLCWFWIEERGNVPDLEFARCI
jgi:hypothetical protein